MKKTSLLLFIGALLAPAAARAKDIDRKALFAHIHKTFNTPPELKFSLKDLVPSPIPGFLYGKIELGDGQMRREQPIHIAEDGRVYFLGQAFPLVPSPIAGMRAPAARPDAPPPPPLHVTADGQFAVFGDSLDLAVDPDAENLKKIKLQGAPFQGPAGAPITIVEYSDLQCPHCKHAHDILASELPKAYPGKVRRVFKHYPLVNTHPWAYDAALAAACAPTAAASAALESAFFQQQDAIKKENVRENSLAFAAKAKLDAAKFQKCLDGKESKPFVDSGIAEGQSLGINGTPQLFVNGRRLRSYEWREVKASIDEALSH